MNCTYFTDACVLSAHRMRIACAIFPWNRKFQGFKIHIDTKWRSVSHASLYTLSRVAIARLSGNFSFSDGSLIATSFSFRLQ